MQLAFQRSQYFVHIIVNSGCGRELPIDELDQGDEAEAKAGSYQAASLGEETHLRLKTWLSCILLSTLSYVKNNFILNSYMCTLFRMSWDLGFDWVAFSCQDSGQLSRMISFYIWDVLGCGCTLRLLRWVLSFVCCVCALMNYFVAILTKEGKHQTMTKWL